MTIRLQNALMLYRVRTLPQHPLHWKTASWPTTLPRCTLAPSLSILALLVSFLTLLKSKTLFFQGIFFPFKIVANVFVLVSLVDFWDWSGLVRLRFVHVWVLAYGILGWRNLVLVFLRVCVMVCGNLIGKIFNFYRLFSRSCYSFIYCLKIFLCVLF